MSALTDTSAVPDVVLTVKVWFAPGSPPIALVEVVSSGKRLGGWAEVVLMKIVNSAVPWTGEE